MKKPIVIFIIIAVVVIVGFGAYTLSQNLFTSDSMMKKDVTVMLKEETSMQPTDATMKKDNNVQEDKKMMDEKTAARYVQYEKVTFNSMLSERRVLFFYASWCPTCRPADENFKKNEGIIPEDVTLIRVNYNDPETDQEEKDLARKYGVTYQHTFVQIDSSENVVTKWNGGQIDELLQNIK